MRPEGRARVPGQRINHAAGRQKRLVQPASTRDIKIATQNHQPVRRLLVDQFRNLHQFVIFLPGKDVIAAPVSGVIGRQMRIHHDHGQFVALALADQHAFMQNPVCQRWRVPQAAIREELKLYAPQL